MLGSDDSASVSRGNEPTLKRNPLKQAADFTECDTGRQCKTMQNRAEIMQTTEEGDGRRP